MAYSRFSTSAWFVLLSVPVVLYSQSADKNAELAQRQTQIDGVTRSNPKTEAAKLQTAVETLQELQTDTDRLNKLSQELKVELAINNPRLLSEESLKRNDEMEKLVKKIRLTMKKAAGK